MSNDPLSLSQIRSGVPNAADYDAVYAAIVATERGRWFLTEYASRNRTADTNMLAGAIARVEAAIRGELPASSTAVPFRDLIDLSLEIERILAAIGPEGMQAIDGLAAVERVQDIAFTLREREADPTLCDALDAAAREIADSCAHNDALAGRLHKAAGLLRDLAGRVGNMMSQSITSDDELPKGNGLFEMNIEDYGSFAQAVAAIAGMLPSLSGQRTTVADAAAPMRVASSGAVVNGATSRTVQYNAVTRGSASHGLAGNGVGTNGVETKLAATNVATLHTLRTGLRQREQQPPPDPGEDPGELFEPANSPAPPRGAATPAPAKQANARPAASDALASLRSLSEEELIALFS